MHKEPIDILLMEDNSSDTCRLREIVGAHSDSSVNMVWANDLSKGMAMLAKKSFDIVVSDLNLRESRGLSTLYWILEHAPHLPVVMMLSADDETLRLDAVRHGAQSCLVKGEVNGKEFIQTVRQAILRKRIEEALQPTEPPLAEISSST